MMTDMPERKPKRVIELETAYGATSQAGYGSAVFYEQLKKNDRLELKAQEKYKYFVGGLWERYGEKAWMVPWKKVFERKREARPDILAELRAIQDFQAVNSVPMILDVIENAGRARSALSSAYDDPAISELMVFNLGDGGAMSGLLIAGRQNDTGEAVFLVFLMD